MAFTIRLPRLGVAWRTQPALFERYWDEAMTSLEETLNAILAIPILETAVETAQDTAEAAIPKSIATSAGLFLRSTASGVWAAIDAAATRAALSLDTLYLQIANNLSDLADAATARVNLGLGNVDNTSDADKPVSTATQAALDGKVSNGPAFSAYRNSSQALTSGVFAKVGLDTEDFDTANAFDTATNRFQPTVPGYYYISGSVAFDNTTTRGLIALYKNGSVFRRGDDVQGAVNQITGGWLVHLNGSTDYLELYTFATFAGAVNVVAGSTFTYMTGHFVRSA